MHRPFTAPVAYRDRLPAVMCASHETGCARRRAPNRFIA